MLSKIRRALRRKISNGLKSGKYFIALWWIGEDGKPHWQIETLDFPHKILPDVKAQLEAFMSKEENDARANDMVKNAVKKVTKG